MPKTTCAHLDWLDSCCIGDLEQTLSLWLSAQRKMKMSVCQPVAVHYNVKSSWQSLHKSGGIKRIIGEHTLNPVDIVNTMHAIERTWSIPSNWSYLGPISICCWAHQKSIFKWKAHNCGHPGDRRPPRGEADMANQCSHLSCQRHKPSQGASIHLRAK